MATRLEQLEALAGAVSLMRESQIACDAYASMNRPQSAYWHAKRCESVVDGLLKGIGNAPGGQKGLFDPPGEPVQAADRSEGGK